MKGVIKVRKRFNNISDVHVVAVHDLVLIVAEALHSRSLEPERLYHPSPKTAIDIINEGTGK